MTLAMAAAVALAAFALVVAAWGLWRRADEASRQLVRCLAALPLGAKLRLALRLASDGRIPLAVRFLPPALVLYLALPLDLLPDFLPVLGQLDDVLIVGAGLVLLLRLTPRALLAEHLRLLESPGRGDAQGGLR